MKAHAQKFIQHRGVVFTRSAPTPDELNAAQREAASAAAGVFRARPSPAKSGCYSCFAGLGEAPASDALVTYVANITLFTPSFFANALPYILGLNKEFDNLGWEARIALVGDTGHVYTNFKITLSKKGRKPFSPVEAKAATIKAVASQAFSMNYYGEVVGEWIKFTAEAPSTALSDKGRAQTRATTGWFGDQVRKVVGSALCTTVETATGLSCTTVLVGAAVIGLGAVAVIYSPVIVPVVTSTKRALFGK